MDHLAELKKHKAVNTFLKNCEKNMSAALATFLAFPLKRINQYEFWLEKIFERTATTDPDYKNLEDATEQISNLSDILVRGNVKSGELAQIIAIQKKLTGYSENLVEQDKILYKEAPLKIFNQKKGKEGPKKFHNYMCWLFNDTLIYASKSKITSRVTKVKHSADILNQTYKYQGHVLVHRMSIQDMEDTETIKFAFQFLHKDGKEPLVVCANSSQEKTEWMQAISKAILESIKRKVFGVPLEELMGHTSEQGKVVPSIMENIIRVLESNVTVEGIFRLSGSAQLIEKLKDQLDRGKMVEYDQIKDVNAIAGLFKAWLRELPDPLLTFKLYNNWIEAAKMEGKDKISALKAQLNLLPPINKFVMHTLCGLLVKIAAKGNINKMHPMNLSIVIGPNILYKQNADSYDTSDLKYGYDLVQLFIDQYNEIFAGVEEERQQYEEKLTKDLEEKKERELAGKEKIKTEQKEEKNGQRSENQTRKGNQRKERP